MVTWWIIFIFKLALILALLPSGYWFTPSYGSLEHQGLSSAPSFCWILPSTASPQSGLGNETWVGIMQPRHQFQKWGRKETSNFQAKYKNGNRKKGILNLHLNIRSLNNKVIEVKNLIKQTFLACLSVS